MRCSRRKAPCGIACRLSEPHITVVIIRPHRTHCTDAAYYHRRRTFRGLCICVYVGHTGELCKNGWIDRDVVWDADSSGPKEPRIRSGCTLSPPGKYGWTIRARQRYGLESNYFNQSLFSSSLFVVYLFLRPCFPDSAYLRRLAVTLL